MKYEIWKLPLSNPNKFMGSQYRKGPVKIEDYVMVYSGKTGDTMGNRRILEMLFDKFNNDHPADYHSSSMSVSDLVCTINDNNNERTWWYVDDIGFEKVEV